MSGARPSDAGFTLVEALVSLFVFSLISAGCVLLLMQSVDSQRRVTEAHAALREVQTARALLSADVAQLVRRPITGPDGARWPYFTGGADAFGLALVRAGAEPDGEGGAVTSLARVEYRIEQGALVRVSRPELDARDVQAGAAGRIVIANAEGARFEFFDGAGWHQQWIGADGAPPRAVALIFESPRYGEVRIETLVGTAL